MNPTREIISDRFQKSSQTKTKKDFSANSLVGMATGLLASATT
jgi:hypothetical protein